MDGKTVLSMVEEYGEVMVKTSSGAVFELHKHNVSLENGMIKIDGAKETYWLPPENIDYLWIHRRAMD